MTLIDKLNKHKETIAVLRGTEKQGSVVFTFLGHHLLGLQTAIDIVKEHSEWIPVSEEIPVLEVECGFRRFEPTNFYQIIDNEGCLHNAYFSTNHYANDDRALFTLCELSLYNGKWLVDDEYEVITVNMVKFWKPIQPPSEV